MPRALTASERIYRLLIRLYPSSFRREFGHEMTLDFDEAGREAWNDRRWEGLITFWGRMSADIAVTVAIQWMRTGLPAIALVSVVVAMGVTGAAAQIVPRGPMGSTLTPDERDLAMIILLIGVVLSVIAATILFTVWFTRPLTRRRR